MTVLPQDDELPQDDDLRQEGGLIRSAMPSLSDIVAVEPEQFPCASDISQGMAEIAGTFGLQVWFESGTKSCRDRGPEIIDC